ncbi:MAG: glycosyltransferase family 2 protein [Bacteroidales bacterium]|nr:glycosyltransferase family 2 protein [Bacteroidales bacterium]
MLSYGLLSVISAFYLRRYMKRQSYTDYNQIISSPFAPSISMIAPAFNEEISIVENIRSLMSLFYHDFEVIIVNDGSKDTTLETVIKAYDLEPVDFAVPNYLPSKKIRNVYKSRNRSFRNLMVVDKENGGKADALNAGINVSTKNYFIAIDVDSVIESDSLLRLAKPFLEEKDNRVIAVGGSIRVANSCILEDGQIKAVKVPRNFWARFQVIEYTRAFLMGRIAWSELDGLLIISGALGLFDKEIAIKCGGYYADTVGEDMELVVRMRRYMSEKRQPYRVRSIPDSLCWTEVPGSARILGRQRNRWTRGMIETLFSHKRVFFNPRYGAMGLLGYPYFFFFEWLAPLVEFFGLLYFILIAILGDPNWEFFFLLLAFVYMFAILFSTFAILFEQKTFNRYKRNRQMFSLLLSAILEPLIFHPLTVWWGLKGNFDYFILQKKAWGKMTRVGFAKKT